jgi:hypothetical protein
LKHTLDLTRIRALDGTQHFAFEELCCQLVCIESRKNNLPFFRKGKGADAGVECFTRDSDSHEIGWQAKFFKTLGSAQVTQLTESFETAVQKHPALIRYTVCLPIDLKDGRIGRKDSELVVWQKWVERAQKFAENNGRTIAMELWSATDIRERLFRNDPYYAGRVAFFFDKTHLNADWFDRKLQSTLKALGERYTPKFHVELPIRLAINASARHDSLNLAKSQLLKRLTNASSSAQHLPRGIEIPHSIVENLSTSISNTLTLFERDCAPDEDYALNDYAASLKQMVASANEALNKCEIAFPLSEDDERGKTLRDVRYKLYDYRSVATDLLDEISQPKWTLANSRTVLLSGTAGSGKSHLLADVAQDSLYRGKPAILLLGSGFVDAEIKQQILAQLDCLGMPFEVFLGALDAAAQSAGVRALLMVDALNERNGSHVWRNRIEELANDIGRFKHVTFVVSCRSTYVDHVFGGSSSFLSLATQIEHEGFGSSPGAAREYLANRKITRPSSPTLLAEFNNPLFLKTICDALEKQQQTTIPKGVQGLTRVFEWYQAACTALIDERMGLIPSKRTVWRALDALVNQMVTTGSGYVPADTTRALFDSIYPSNSELSRDLLTELEHEGIVSVELSSATSDSQQDEETVRFTFERFSDFAIATKLMEESFESQPLTAIDPESSLGVFLISKSHDSYFGVLEALAVLLPEKRNIELPDVNMDFDGKWHAWSAFNEGLLIRSPQSFSTRTRELVLGETQSGYGEWLETLIAISTEPDNPFNADYIHPKLRALSLPDRDASWSRHIARMSLEDGSHLDTLLRWGVESAGDHIEDARVTLALQIFGWLLGTSHREIRDRATKAIVGMLSIRLQFAVSLLESFGSIDDPYIEERLLAGIYGAMLQGQNSPHVGVVALAVYRRIYESGSAPTNILIRDYAKGIVDFAKRAGAKEFEGISVAACDPTWSAWPPRWVSIEDLKMLETENANGFLRDVIANSCTGWIGDFGIYKISPAVNQWTITPRTKAKPETFTQCFTQWFDRFAKFATIEQVSVLSELRTERQRAIKRERQSNFLSREAYSDALKIERVVADSSAIENDRKEQARYEEIEKRFAETLTRDQTLDYVLHAQTFLLLTRSHGFDKQPVSLDTKFARRWVAWRAHQFGWSRERHGEFDDSVGSGRSRNNKHIERIGKKYQWLALYELMAILSDHMHFIGSFRREPRQYVSARQADIRNIDPSLLATKTNRESWWSNERQVWWSPHLLRLPKLSRADQVQWIKTSEQQVNDATLIEVTEPQSKRRWFVIDNHVFTSTYDDKASNLELWCSIDCVVVKKGELASFVKQISPRVKELKGLMPQIETNRDTFLGELFLEPESESTHWQSLTSSVGCGIEVLPTTLEYQVSRSETDYSVESDVSLSLPAPWLVTAMRCRLVNGQALTFVTDDGTTVCFDPTTKEHGAKATLVDRDHFLSALRSRGLEPVWIICGEKGAHGKKDGDFAGRRFLSCLYSVDGSGSLVRHEEFVSYEWPAD